MLYIDFIDIIYIYIYIYLYIYIYMYIVHNCLDGFENSIS